jgi:hypothetical protein
VQGGCASQQLQENVGTHALTTSRAVDLMQPLSKACIAVMLVLFDGFFIVQVYLVLHGNEARSQEVQLLRW